MAIFRSRFNKLFSLFSAGILVLGLAACSGNTSDSESESDTAAISSASTEWPRTIDTDDGELTLDEQPQRIVSTSTTLTGSLLAIDAPVIASSYTGANNPGLTDQYGFFSQWTQAAEEADLEPLWSNAEPQIERAAVLEPDLIVVSKNGGDSRFEMVDQLKTIAPVLVLDYSGADWQDITKTLGEATGKESEAEAVIQEFDDRLEEVKEAISIPTDKKVSPFIIFGGGSGVAALTHEAPHTRILEQIGFDVTDIPEDLKGDTSMGANRPDIVSLAFENVTRGLPGDIWIIVGVTPDNVEIFENTPILSESQQNKDGNVHFTPGETFRLDYYSAMMMLDSIEESFI